MEQTDSSTYSYVGYVLGLVSGLFVAVLGEVLRDQYRRRRDERDRKTLTAVKETLSVSIANDQVTVHVYLFNSGPRPVRINSVRFVTGTGLIGVGASDIVLKESDKHYFEIGLWASDPSSELDALEIVHSENVVCRRKIPADIRERMDTERAKLSKSTP